ncbi:MAG: serine/threonine protein kinase [Lachnospiraceae bacterium]|nr:serine/threonine protein kinase [Lachnospiraceae bacterium]
MMRVYHQKYQVLEKLGQGSSGQVYKVRDLHLDKIWAMKEIPSGGSRELQALKRMSHPRFPRIVDAFREGGRNYLVMDYVEGRTLEDILHRGSLPEQEAVWLTGQIAEALQYLHEMTPPLLYLDLKPSNIMVTPEKEVKLIDLGSVALQGAKEQISGTVGYASPEQMRLARGAGLHQGSDIYSLGMVLFAMITGKVRGLPLVTEGSRRGILAGRYMPEISSGTEAVIEKCTRGNPSRRYGSLREVREELKHWRKRRRPGWYLGCQRQYWHQEKSILYTAGKSCMEMAGKLFYWTIPVLLAAAGGMMLYTSKEKTYAAETENVPLEVTLRDPLWRKILIRAGSVYRTDDNLILEIPWEMLEKDEVYEFELSGKTGDGQKKSFSFLCAYKNQG